MSKSYIVIEGKETVMLGEPINVIGNSGSASGHLVEITHEGITVKRLNGIKRLMLYSDIIECNGIRGHVKACNVK